MAEGIITVADIVWAVATVSLAFAELLSALIENRRHLNGSFA